MTKPTPEQIQVVEGVLFGAKLMGGGCAPRSEALGALLRYCKECDPQSIADQTRDAIAKWISLTIGMGRGFCAQDVANRKLSIRDGKVAVE